jgi:hypothetical protein
MTGFTAVTQKLVNFGNIWTRLTCNLQLLFSIESKKNHISLSQKTIAELLCYLAQLDHRICESTNRIGLAQDVVQW